MSLLKKIRRTAPTRETAAARAADYRDGKLTALTLDGFLLLDDIEAQNAVYAIIGPHSRRHERQRDAANLIMRLLRGESFTAEQISAMYREDSARNLNVARDEYLTPIREHGGDYSILRREAEAFFDPVERLAQVKSVFDYRFGSSVQRIAANACELEQVLDNGELVTVKMHELAAQPVVSTTSGKSSVSLADAANDACNSAEDAA